MSTPTKAAYVPTKFNSIRRNDKTGVLFLWFKFKGKRHQPSLNTTDPKLAEVRRDEEIKKIKAEFAVTGGARSVENITFGELLDRLQNTFEKRVGLLTGAGITASTLRVTKTSIGKIRFDRQNWLARPAAKITPEEL